jgi:glucose-1-phosphate thymidylyltransferase
LLKNGDGPIKAVILAGGFAKRMGDLTKDRPKHLLEIATRPMLEYVLDKVIAVPNIERVYISTNAKFEDHFRRFLDGYIGCPPFVDVELVIEEAVNEKEKLGSVGALAYLISTKNIESDLLIVGGDNLFDFDIGKVKEFYEQKNSNVIVVYDVKSIDLAKLYGIVTLDDTDKIIKFQEKSEEPNTTLASTACYFFTKKGVKLINQYIEEGQSKDALGHFIEWLAQKTDVYGYIHRGKWFDIGGLESFNEADAYFSEQRKKMWG